MNPITGRTQTREIGRIESPAAMYAADNTHLVEGSFWHRFSVEGRFKRSGTGNPIRSEIHDARSATLDQAYALSPVACHLFSHPNRHHPIRMHPPTKRTANLVRSHRLDFPGKGVEIVQRQVVETDHRQVFHDLAVG